MKLNKSLATAVMLFSLLFLSVGSSYAQFSLGADVVSRYVWRGFDFGDQLSVQPAIAYTSGGFEIGAWGSFGVADGSANENDLYASYSAGPVSFVVTDYFFPTFGDDDFFNYSDKDGVHVIELGASYGIDALSLSGYINVSGDSENSFYAEASYALGEYEGIEAGLTAGIGTGVYDAQIGNETNYDLSVTNIGLSVSKESLSAAYIINPSLKTAFLVFGYSF